MGSSLHALHACRDRSLVKSDSTLASGSQQVAGETQFHTVQTTLDNRFAVFQKSPVYLRKTQFVKHETVAAFVYAENGAGCRGPAASHGNPEQFATGLELLEDRNNAFPPGDWFPRRIAMHHKNVLQ